MGMSKTKGVAKLEVISKDQLIKLINDLDKSKDFLIGSKKIFKNILMNKISNVIVCSNCPSVLKIQLMYYSSIKNIKFSIFDGVNLELAAASKFPFKLSC